MSGRGTWILIVVVLLVGGYVWFEGPLPSAPGGAPETAGSRPGPESVHPLVHFTPDDVLAVQLTRQTDTITTERRDGRWSAVSTPAVVDDFLHNLVGIGILADIPAADAELRDFGLQPPQGVIELKVRGLAEPVVLLIGDRNPTTTAVYVRLGHSGPVVLAGALVEWEFDKAFRALVPQRP